LIAILSFSVSLTAKTPGSNSPLIAEKSKTHPYLGIFTRRIQQDQRKSLAINNLSSWQFLAKAQS